MSNLSNERLKEIAAHEIGSDAYPRRAEWQAMARELLAYRKAQGKPVVCEYGESNGDGSYSVVYGRYPIPSYIKVSPDWPIKLFYAAPQLPAVPDEMTPEMVRAVQLHSELGIYAANNLSGAYDLFREFWSVACRAEMLAAAPKPE